MRTRVVADLSDSIYIHNERTRLMPQVRCRRWLRQELWLLRCCKLFLTVTSIFKAKLTDFRPAPFKSPLRCTTIWVFQSDRADLAVNVNVERWPSCQEQDARMASSDLFHSKLR